METKLDDLMREGSAVSTASMVETVVSPRITTEPFGTTKTYLEINNIRIYPDCLMFGNPFEGKKYEERIIIQNVGKKPVLIRILGTTSSKIKIKSIKNGVFLPPGLCLKKKVFYTVSMMTMVPSCNVRIYIDKELILYKVEVGTTYIHLVADPNIIDFGTIDAGPNKIKRSTKISNIGLRPAKYSLDFGTNDLGLVAEPLKGIIMESSSVTIHFELGLLVEGKFYAEVWVISECPISIKLFVNCVIGRIEPISQLNISGFTLIKFPPSYYGSIAYKSFHLKNRSQKSSMFCITGEVNNHKLSLHEAEIADPAYKYFRASPLSGKLSPSSISSFLFTFSPCNNVKNQNKEAFMVFMNIIKLHYEDFDNSKYDGERAVYRSSETKSQGTLSTITSETSGEDFQFNSFMLDDLYCDDELALLDESFFEYSVRVLLYGEVETAKVTALPTELVLSDLDINKTVQRVIQLTNKSTTLPIIFSSKKTCFVKVSPNRGYLKPSEKKELSIHITPKSYALVNSAIEFDLIYKVSPCVNNEYKVVGKVKVKLSIQAKILSNPRKPQKIPINKPICKPSDKVGKKLVADNMLLDPYSLKLWNEDTGCKTTYAGISRDKNVQDKYTFNSSELLLKHKNKDIYIQFIRQKAVKSSASPNFLSEVEISMPNDVCSGQASLPLYVKPNQTPVFIPLTAIQLLNISIEPRNWEVENVVAFSEFANIINITNNNHIPIRIYLRPKKAAAFEFPNGYQEIIDPFNKKQMSFSCTCGKSGTEYFTMDIVVNENHVFEVSFIVKIKQKLVRLSAKEIMFRADEPRYKYIEVHNDNNMPVDFKWKYLGDLSVDPLYGSIDVHKTISCVISCQKASSCSNSYDIAICIDGRRNQSVRVIIEDIESVKIDMPKKIDFNNIGAFSPVKQTAILTSESREALDFTVNCSGLMHGLHVEPTFGNIPPYGKQVFTIAAHLGKLGEFNSMMLIKIIGVKVIRVRITGTVLCPEIKYTPQVVRFERISASSFDVQCIKLRNNGDVPIMFKFDVDLYDELRFREKEGCFITKDDIFTIKPQEQNTFEMHLCPFYPVFITYHQLPILYITDNQISNNTNVEKMEIRNSVDLILRVTSYKLIISTWYYYFKYFPCFKFKNVKQQIITISTKLHIKFNIRLDELRDPFDFEHLDGGLISKSPGYIICELESEEKVRFKVSFLPQQPGTYEIKLPVYVEDNIEEKVHNYLTFHGKYYEPAILYNGDSIFMGMHPLNLMVEKDVVFKLEYHEPHCNMMIYCDDESITIIYKPMKVTSIRNECNVTIKYKSNEVHVLKSYIQFKCECGGQFEHKILCLGACENYVFTSYTTFFHYKVINGVAPCAFSYRNLRFKDLAEESCSELSTLSAKSYLDCKTEYKMEIDFPFFPSDMNSKYTQNMEEILHVTEIWLYEQGFYGKVYHKIPDTICVYEIRKILVEKEIKTVVDVPLKILLKNICGKLINKSLDILYEEGIDMLQSLFNLYQNILDFLRRLGAIFSHVEPEFLLTYHHYQKYIKVYGNRKEMNSHDFYQLSKQCWLDVILQIFKIFFLRRITMEPNINPNIEGRKRDSIFARRSLQKDSIFGNALFLTDGVHAPECLYLRAWLNETLQNRMDILEKLLTVSERERKFLRDKIIENFDDDLADGLGFCAVTIYACPYLTKYFESMYIMPERQSEYFHNASTLIKVWHMIHINFSLTSYNIIKPNTIQMILFLVYIHEFLICLRPIERIYIDCNLSQSSRQIIDISNDSNQNLKYEVLFFDNDSEVFKVNESNITIRPCLSHSLVIDYNAKYLKTKNAVLFLCGEIKGRRSFQSKVYKLIGVPLISSPFIHLPLKSQIYESREFNIKFIGPHKEDAEYEIYISVKKPYTNDDLVLVPYHTFLVNRTFDRIRFDEWILKSNSGLIELSGAVCSITSDTQTYYIFFVNRKLGDFLIYVTMEPMKSKLFTPIKLKLAADFKSSICTCASKSSYIKCPRNVVVHVPCINKFLWEAVLTHFFYDINSKERTFWTQNQDLDMITSIFTRVINDNILEMTDNIKCIFKKEKKFSVKTNKMNIAGPKNVTMHTHGCERYSPLTFHLNSNMDMFEVFLASADTSCMEERNYKVYITYS